MAKVGLKNFYYAINSKDDSTGVTYSDPVKIAGLISADIKAGSSMSTLYADNGAVETASALGEISVDIELTDLSLEHYAALAGRTVTGGIMESNNDDTAPYVCIMFESLKSNGNKRYVKLLKGMFSEPENTNKTKDDKVTYQTQKLSGKFLIRYYDGAWCRTADEDASDYVATVGTNWYTSVETV